MNDRVKSWLFLRLGLHPGLFVYLSVAKRGHQHFFVGSHLVISEGQSNLWLVRKSPGALACLKKTWVRSGVEWVEGMSHP